MATVHTSAHRPVASKLLSISEARTGRVQAADEEQLVWVYCQREQEKYDVYSCCQASQRPRRQPREQPKGCHWHQLLHSNMHALPAPYTAADRETFYQDAGALLDASEAAKQVGPTSRWPPLLVTDSEQLCQAAASAYVRCKLAEVARMRDGDLLTVVLATDFGHLCGVVVSGSPLPRTWALSLDSPEVDESEASPSVPLRREAELRCGVFVQRLNLVNIGHEVNSAEEQPAFGARCLALSNDGKASYCAVSPDGTRSVEASGRWEVINGQVVLLGQEPAGPSVSHLQLSKSNTQLLGGCAYEEPVHVSLEELEAFFEKPVAFSECIPRGGHLLRLQLLEEGLSVSAPPQGGTASEAAVLTSALDSTFNTAWDTAGLPGPASMDAPKSDQAADERAYFLRTPVHALLSLANPAPNPHADSEDGRSGPAPAAPRLLGVQRGITTSLPSAADIGWDEPGQASPTQVGEVPETMAMVQGMRRLHGHAIPHQEDAVTRLVSTCPIEPGRYTLESGKSTGYSYKKLEMKLHVDGTCVYKEESKSSLLRAVPNATVWKVESDLLVLDSLKPTTPGFVLRESRGNKSLERKVYRVEMPVSFVRGSCKFTAFEQQKRPFLGHQQHDTSTLIFGVVNPESPALRGLRCRPDRLPYHAFERELRSQGLPVDEILTDFHFVDRDSDGLVSVEDMRRLETYGNPAAAPEVLEELREALVKNFTTLANAFEVLSAMAGAGRVTTAEFQRFFEKIAEASNQGEVPRFAGRPLLAQGERSQSLKDWVGNTDPDARAAVFATLCPGEGEAIDLADFLSLNLHTAVLALRRLEHFQHWIFEGFGRSSEVFRKVFKALGPPEGKGLSRKAFAEGAKALGYPGADVRVIRSVFSLLDRNFDGEISAREFQKLLEFRGEDVLRNLEALKRFVDTMLGGIDACFAKFVERERALQGLPASPKTASYEAFQKTCVQAGFSKVAPKADLKMLFLFLHEMPGRQATGYLSFSEWSLLKGFQSKAIAGSPARLRRIIEEVYGDVDEAFQRMHTAWLRRALAKGLKQTALAGLMHCVLAPKPVSLERAPSRAAGSPVLADSGLSALRVGKPPLPIGSERIRARRILRNGSEKASREASPGRTTPPPSLTPLPPDLAPGIPAGRPASASMLAPVRHKPVGLLPRKALLPPARQAQISAVERNTIQGNDAGRQIR